jgi:hypothetical protein
MKKVLALGKYYVSDFIKSKDFNLLGFPIVSFGKEKPRDLFKDAIMFSNIL